MANVLQMGNDATLTLTSLTNAVTGAAVTDATVTAQPYYIAASGAETAAGSPVSLTLVSGSTYRGTLESSVIGTYYATGAPYRLKFVATSASLDGEWNLRGYVQERGPT